MAAKQWLRFIYLYLSIVVVEDCLPVCGWESWRGWSACSRTCGGGTQTRTRKLCCMFFWSQGDCYKKCGKDPSGTTETQICNTGCSNNGHYNNGCRCNAGYDGFCCQTRICCGNPGTISNGRVTGNNHCYGGTVTYSCNQHYYLDGGSQQRTCTGTSAPGVWTGNAPSCKRICCGHPGSFPNGEIIGSDFCSGGTVAYECNQHYNLTGGSYQRNCSGSPVGAWTGDHPVCTFVNTCASNPCQNSATCIDGLDQYYCQCVHGWSGTHCEMDVLPPAVSGCPDNITVYTAEDTHNVTWSVPVFTDAHDTPVDVTSNFVGSSHNLRWGEHTVQYIGTKRVNGLRAKCLFNVNIYPHPCFTLPIPTHGVYACNGWNGRFTEVCALLCPDDRDVPAGVNINELYVCGGAGAWIPPPSPYGCSETRSSMDTANTPPASRKHYYPPGDCNNATTLDVIRTNYLAIVEDSPFSEMCQRWSSCSPDEVDVVC